METQTSINEWQREIFGPQTRHDAILWKLAEEIAELDHKARRYSGDDEAALANIAEEMADVLIVLYQLAGCLGVDLHAAVTWKMKKNRQRTWKLHGDGTAQHCDEDAEC